MIVRMASVQVAPERIDEIVSRYRQTVRPIHQHSEGLRNHYFLVDRQSGQMRIMGFWGLRKLSRQQCQHSNRLASNFGASSNKHRPLRLTKSLTRSTNFGD